MRFVKPARRECRCCSSRFIICKQITSKAGLFEFYFHFFWENETHKSEPIVSQHHSRMLRFSIAPSHHHGDFVIVSTINSIDYQLPRALFLFGMSGVIAHNSILFLHLSLNFPFLCVDCKLYVEINHQALLILLSTSKVLANSSNFWDWITRNTAYPCYYCGIRH